MSIFVVNRHNIREANGLGHEKFFPEGISTYKELDAVCDNLHEEGKLVVVDAPFIRSGMFTLRNQDLTRAGFQTLADKLQSFLVQQARIEGMNTENSKVGLSVRAGLSFMPNIVRTMPGLEFGFITQERDEENPNIVSNNPSKLKTFRGKTAYLFDPMLATGGSASHAVDAVMAEGAESAVIISSYASPEGVATIAEHPHVDKIITLPLEAGLNERGFIVGGIGTIAMLGDFGDRFFSN